MSPQWEIENLELHPHDDLFESIVVGDFLTLLPGEDWTLRERNNLLARKRGDSTRRSISGRSSQSIASNLDFIVIVASAKSPKFQPGFIDRYLILAQSANIPALICITKSDLKMIRDEVIAWYQKALAISIFHTSCATGFGVEALKNHLRGQTVAFVGKSGVGKSSLINAIAGGNLAKTQSVSEKWWDGQHTTTRAKMYEWDQNSYIVDTPGIRALDFFELSTTELDQYFLDLGPYIRRCRYRNCQHRDEPGCAVRDAMEAGDIPKFRYDAYMRLRLEIETKKHQRSRSS